MVNASQEREASVRPVHDRRSVGWSAVRMLVLAVAMVVGPVQIAKTQTNSTNATSANRLEFLPEVERVLDGRSALGARVYLSFERGTVTMEQGAEDARRNRLWHEDLKYDPAAEREQWTGVDLEAAPATDELWNATPEQVIAALSDNLAPPLPSMQITPGVWFFKTRDGTYGLMRVIGFVEPRPGDKAMKLAYKLAQPSGKSPGLKPVR